MLQTLDMVGVRTRQHDFYDEFLSAPPRHMQQYTVADLDADADLAATNIFSPSVAIYVHDITVMGDGSPAGIDNSNTSVWTVHDGTANMVTVTYQADNAFPADSVSESLGTIALNYIAAGGYMTLAVTNGSTANTPLAHLTIEYTPTDQMVPGWTLVATNDGSALIADGARGSVSLVASDTGTGGDNDEAYLFRSTEVYLLANEKPLEAEWRMQFSEANTDDANILAGFMDAFAANSVLDNGAGPSASYSGLLFFKEDGATLWSVESSIGSTQITSLTDVTAGGSAFQTFRIEAKSRSATEISVTYWIDSSGGQNFKQCRDSTGALIKHTVVLGSPTEMSFGFGIKNGGANTETLVVDFAYAAHIR